MLDKGAIIEEIRIALDEVSKRARDTRRGDDRPWWTKQVMIALCRWGLEKGLWVGAANMEHRRDLNRLAKKHGGNVEKEWLHDFTCVKYSPDDWLKRIVLVAECEWGNRNAINYDFEKLLVARADVRAMIFDGNIRPPSDAVAVFRRYIRRCEHTCDGDTWLFAARLHGREDGGAVQYRFDHCPFIA